MAREFLKGENYTLIDAEEHLDLVRKYGIRQAPTLVIDDGGEKPLLYINASSIRRYAESTAQ